ncbi:MAG: hypothetical protein R6U44_00610 [Archaeoglobaceae archaeon]
MHKCPIDVEKFLIENEIPEDILVYEFKLSNFSGGSKGFVNRLINSLEEYGTTVDSETLYNVILEVRRLNIILHEKSYWENIELKPRVRGGHEVIIELLITVFIPCFLYSMGIGMGSTLPYILKKKFENELEVKKQRELDDLEIRKFQKKLDILKEHIRVKEERTVEDLLEDVTEEYVKNIKDTK